MELDTRTGNNRQELGGEKEVGAREQRERKESLFKMNAFLRDVRGMTQPERGEFLGRGERTIRGLDKLDTDYALYYALKDDGYPNKVIDLILEAVARPKRDLDDEWGDRITSSLRNSEGIIRWVGADLDCYIWTIRAAELLEDFQTQFVEILSEHHRDDFAVVTWLADVRSGISV